jgi:DNA-binding winged helix-turn-helix (wHTH) protein
LIFRFEDLAIDVDRRELKRGQELIAVEPQVFDLLIYLIRNKDRVVSKDDLIEGVWGGRIVSESTLASRINAVRRAIGDSGAEQRLIRTVARKGLRFVGELQPDAVAPAAPARPSGVPSATDLRRDTRRRSPAAFLSRNARS